MGMAREHKINGIVQEYERICRGYKDFEPFDVSGEEKIFWVCRGDNVFESPASTVKDLVRKYDDVMLMDYDQSGDWQPPSNFGF